MVSVLQKEQVGFREEISHCHGCRPGSVQFQLPDEIRGQHNPRHHQSPEEMPMMNSSSTQLSIISISTSIVIQQEQKFNNCNVKYCDR